MQGTSCEFLGILGSGVVPLVVGQTEEVTSGKYGVIQAELRDHGGFMALTKDGFAWGGFFCFLCLA